MYEKNGICYAGELVAGIEVESFKLLQDGIMIITFTTGEKRIFDVFNLLNKGSVFAPLSDEKNMQTAKLTYGFISWMDGEIDIAPEVLYEESYRYTEENLEMEKAHA